MWYVGLAASPDRHIRCKEFLCEDCDEDVAARLLTFGLCEYHKPIMHVSRWLRDGR